MSAISKILNSLKRIFINLLFILIIFIIFLTIIEAVLRKTHLFGAHRTCFRPDNKIYTRFIPNSVYWFKEENDHAIISKINNYGWRDKRWDVIKPENVFRIAILGDSYVEALQVELDSTFIYLTQKKLNKVYNTIELMNFSKSGFTQTQELIVLEEDVLKFNPDMLIVFFTCRNDIRDVRKETCPNFMRRPFFIDANEDSLILDTSFTKTREFKIFSMINPILRHSALLTMVLKRYHTWKRAKETLNFYNKNNDTANNVKIEGYKSLCTKNPDPQFLKSYGLNKILMKKMIDLCKNQNTIFLLVCISNSEYIPENEDKIKKIDSSYDPYFFERDLKMFSDSLDVHFLDLQTSFRKSYKSYQKELHWVHWNYEGHKVVSEALTNKLLSIIPNQNMNK